MFTVVIQVRGDGGNLMCRLQCEKGRGHEVECILKSGANIFMGSF